MGERTSVRLDVDYNMSPSSATALNLSESYCTSHVQSKQHCCTDPRRLALSTFPLRAYIELLISLRLFLPWGASIYYQTG